MFRIFLALFALEFANAHDVHIDHITAAVCQVETGTIYRAPGNVHGRYATGAYGETGPWQITPMVLVILRDRGTIAKMPSTVADHERAFRGWYLYLLSKTGSQREALAAYHRGLSGRRKASARDYSDRVLNLAHRLASESTN